MINAQLSQESLEAVQALLFAEGTQQAPAPQPCPPKKPKEPPQPRQPQPPRPPQPPQPVTAAQQDPTVQRQKKPKCTPQPRSQQNAVNHAEDEQSIAEKKRKIKALQREGHPASILIKQVRDSEDHSEVLDFARCQRADGTYYGTSGKCRKGTEAGAKEEEKKEPRRRRSEDTPKTERQPRQRRERAPKKKEEAPAPGAKKPEGPVYKVRAEEKSPGLLSRLRDKVLGRHKVGIGEHGDEEKLRKRKQDILTRLQSRGAPKSQLKKVEKHWERMASAAAENQAFSDRLTKNLPKGFKPEFDDDGITLTKTTKSGDRVRVTYSPSNGFHFKVNDTESAGSVKNRRGQVEVAMSVRDAYNAVVRSLPEGAIVRTAAYGGDGKGAGRESAYVRMGFSRPEKAEGDMYAVKLSGDRMGPATAQQYDKQASQNGSLWFAEGDENAEVKNWMMAVFGDDSASVADHSEVLDFTRCQRSNGTHYGTAGQCRKGVEVGYDEWSELARGNYGRIAVSPDGTRVVKTLLEHEGKKGEFGEFELEIAKKMGEMGHSPRIHSSSDDHIEMDIAKGKTLWKGYARGEGEPRMNAAQARNAAAAIRDLHKMGFAHGDLHSLQFLVDGNNTKLVDFGLSVPASRQPSRVMQDLSKINGLVNWKNPELADDKYVQLVNKYLDPYREVKGVSKAAKDKKTKLGEQYLEELKSL